MSRFAAFSLVLLLLSTGPSLAQPPDTVWLEDLTWTELRDLVASGTTTIIIPVGGVEQSGPDMALGKHDVRAKVLSEKIARALGHALVAPVIAYVPEGGISPATSHMRFPGTITVPPDVFRKTVASAAMSFEIHGFKDVVLIGEHGGYQGDLAAVADELNRKWAATPARAHFIPIYYKAATTGFSATLREHGYSSTEAGTHAGVADTSLTMAVDPGFVRAEALRSGTDLDAAHGVYGDPRRSNPEMGKLAVESIVAQTTAAIRSAVERPRHP